MKCEWITCYLHCMAPNNLGKTPVFFYLPFIWKQWCWHWNIHRNTQDKLVRLNMRLRLMCNLTRAICALWSHLLERRRYVGVSSALQGVGGHVRRARPFITAHWGQAPGNIWQHALGEERPTHKHPQATWLIKLVARRFVFIQQLILLPLIRHQTGQLKDTRVSQSAKSGSNLSALMEHCCELTSSKGDISVWKKAKGTH